MEDIYVIGHKNPDTDSVVSSIVLAGILGYKPAVAGVINQETVFVLNHFHIAPPELLISGEGKKLFLVDHNEALQMVDQGDKAEIVGVFDHHKVNFNYSSPIWFICEPVGSTATVIYENYKNEVMSDPVVAGLILSAILSDTVIFKSPTVTERDKAAAAALATVAGITDVVAFGIEIKKANAGITGKDIKEVISGDFKDFDINGKKVGIGQVEVVDLSEAIERKAEIFSRLMEIKATGYELVLFAATDIMNEGSELFFAGDAAVIEKAFGTQPESSESVYVKGLMSRKKQIVPAIETVYKS